MPRLRRLILIALAAICLATAAQAQLPPILDYRGKLVAGEWAWRFEPSATFPVADAHEFTGFAFGPGRAEIAYCGRDEPDSAFALRVVAVPIVEGRRGPRPKPPEGPPRLLWLAPEGVALRGPLWWAPDGSSIAVRACTEESSDLVVVDYVTGEPTWVTQQAQVADAAWRPNASQIAYVTESETEQIVWLQTLPSGEPKRIGQGGLNLRWSVDGQEVSWVQPDPAGWTRVWWDVRGAAATAADPIHARPVGTLWSPDGLWCAALEASSETDENELVIYRAASAEGTAVDLPGIEPTQLLGWSPDSSLVMVLGDDTYPIAAPPQPIPPEVRHVLPSRRGLYSPARAALAACQIDAEAGPPSWSTGGPTMVAYVGASEMTMPAGGIPPPEHGGVLVVGREEVTAPPTRVYAPEHAGKLVVSAVEREYVGGPAEAAERIERQQLHYNIQNFALCIQMYFADNNDVFPPASEMAEIRRLLDEYVYSQEVFLRPGSEDEVAIRYLVEPGLKLVEISDPVHLPIAIIDYPEDYYLVAYADGHATLFEGQLPPELAEQREP